MATMETRTATTGATTTGTFSVKDAEREYIVFGQTAVIDAPDNPGWQEVGRASAAKADDARDKIIDKLPLDEQAGPFVTIAARYWQPETFEIETTTVRKRR